MILDTSTDTLATDAKASGASIVVCCHNSAARIEPTIEHLARQQTDRPWEVIVIDNGSTDDTGDRAQQTWARLGAPTELRVVHESRLGLSYARERGVAEALYEYIVFCDDDNWLDAQFIQLASEIMDSRPDVGALGGACLPVSDVEFPPWFWTHAKSYAVGAQALESGDITTSRLVWGAGMVLRRSVYVRILSAGFRNLLTDRRGNELTTGGDGEISKWFILAGYRLWYDERLRLTHFIPSERLTKEYCQRLRGHANRAFDVMKHYHLVLDATSNTRFSDRVTNLCRGIFMICRGDKTARATLQAYHPLPGLVIDQTTREIQIVAQRIREVKSLSQK